MPKEGLVPSAARAPGVADGMGLAEVGGGRLEPGNTGAAVVPSAGDPGVATDTAGDGLMPGAGDAPDGHRLQVEAQ